ncbi:hypothetical protein [Bradyrhizobium sp. HKCCYLS20291]|uniref:hypothetical protein n=1 Tax=Bradyrhizobium sp. HKCCYLS20291 TaxID=3420766 RepID=UPI003EB9FFE8
MRIAGLTLAIVVIGSHPSLAQDVLIEATGFPQGRNASCPSGTYYVIRNPQDSTGVCLKFGALGATDEIKNSRKNIEATVALEKKVSELTASNELLSKNVESLSKAIDALTARLDKEQGK